jgi:hypothetical protein
MACGTGFCAGKLIAGIVAVGLGGFGAYNYATTGCFLGSCSTETTPLTEISATTDEGGCCPLTGDAMLEVASAETACDGAAKSECSEAKDCSEAVACTGDAMLEVANTEAAACTAKTECGDKTACADKDNCDPASCTGCGEMAQKATEKSDG